jgi:hypothetical protein
MKCLLLVLLLSTFAWSATVYVASGTNTIVSNGTVTVSTYPYGSFVPTSPSNAKWIWNQNWATSPVG